MFVKRRKNNEIVIDAPAKVNLFLEVLNKRPDGYHNINSLFQAVSLFDRLYFTPVPKAGISIHLETNVDLPVGEDNLVAKAYRLMKERFALGRGLVVKLEKRIPVSAGLGGGSSDGAAAILACNLLFNLKLHSSQMAKLSLALGSDLPFFFSSGQALVSGRGEVVEETRWPIDYRMVLVTPDIALSTAVSYAALKRGLTKSKSPYSLTCCRTVEDLLGSLRLAGNDFEEVHLRSFPELGRIKDELLKRGALLARMTGSGPTMFGVFKQVPQTEADEMFDRGNWRLHTVEPISPAGQA
jgi:4-diphosphocytidyl-2-C-methyl-D-erythritol kinase